MRVARFTEKGEAWARLLALAKAALLEPAALAAGHDEPSACAHQVDQDFTLRGGDHGAVRNWEDHVGAVRAVAVIALAGPAAAGPAMRRAVIVEQRRGAGVDDEDDVAAVAAVAAVGPAERLELLPPDRHAKPCPPSPAVRCSTTRSTNDGIATMHLLTRTVLVDHGETGVLTFCAPFLHDQREVGT